MKIRKPLTNTIIDFSTIAYETKYNGQISNLHSNYFYMTFYEINKNTTYDFSCYFKKVEGQDLQLLCEISSFY